MQTVRKLFNDWWLIHSGTGKSLGRTREGGGRSGRRVVERGRKKEKTKPLKKNIYLKQRKKIYIKRKKKLYLYLYIQPREPQTLYCVCVCAPTKSFRSRCLPGISILFSCYTFTKFVIHFLHTHTATYNWDFVLFAMFVRRPDMSI